MNKLIGLSVLFLMGCGTGDSSTFGNLGIVSPICEPGKQEQCPCPNGQVGAQACNEFGNGFLMCQCSASTVTSSSSTGAGTVSAVSSSSSNSSANSNSSSVGTGGGATVGSGGAGGDGGMGGVGGASSSVTSSSTSNSSSVSSSVSSSASSSASTSGSGMCQPKSCLTQGFSCGIADDTCGNNINCGVCDVAMNAFNKCGNAKPAFNPMDGMVEPVSGKANVCGGGCTSTTGCNGAICKDGITSCVHATVCSVTNFNMPPDPNCSFGGGDTWCCSKVINFGM